MCKVLGQESNIYVLDIILYSGTNSYVSQSILIFVPSWKSFYFFYLEKAKKAVSFAIINWLSLPKISE
jgi:hypothetical protein